MNGRVVWAIARKDLTEVLSNRMAWMPALMVPLIFTVALPLALFVLGPVKPLPPMWLEQLKAVLPADLFKAMQGLGPLQQGAIFMTGHLFAPMFLVIPLMLATIVGANAFVGEKERKTLEALLYTPATDAEIFLGKTLASVIPAVAIAWGSFALYAVVLNTVAWPYLGRIWFPTPSWWPLMLWVAPAIAGLGMIVTVIVSARVSTFMEANQAAGMLSIGVVGLMASQATGVLLLTAPVALAIGAAVWAVDGVLLVIAIKTFSRAKVITRL
ncbi:MAG: ABC transporter permease subunit [Candidatus Sericytochromatia bacterium]